MTSASRSELVPISRITDNRGEVPVGKSFLAFGNLEKMDCLRAVALASEAKSA
jgi:hypothetical protein